MENTRDTLVPDFNLAQEPNTAQTQDGKLIVEQFDPRGYLLQVFEQNEGRALLVRVSCGNAVKERFFDANCAALSDDDYLQTIQAAEILAADLDNDLLTRRGRDAILACKR